MPTALVTPDQDSIIAEIEIAAPPERVFRALTQRDQLMRWWTTDVCELELWEFDARLGGKWRFVTKESSLTINGVSKFAAEGEVLEFDPPRLLVYTWIANWHADRTRRTVVRWELNRTQSGTVVKVTHSGLAQEDVARKDYTGGWTGVLELLRRHVEK
ncbi:MAG: hypothetical protein DMG89_04300 [Acidobacteria bacterium]|nr:MAG: hypothetical protein DMG89_04300 [Acidobacteriota bacterium]